MKARHWCAAIVLSFVLAACGSPDDEGASRAGGSSGDLESPVSVADSPVASAPDDGDSPVASTPGAGIGGGTQIVEPRPGMDGVRARAFTRAFPVDDDTVKVVFFSGIEPCAVLDHVDVEETKESVTITLFEGHDPDGGDEPCIELAVKKAVMVDLEAPLADRKILDGAPS